MPHVLAIDQGTTGSRAIIFDGDGAVVSSAYEPFRQMYPRPGWVEHDPEEIWAGVASCISRALADAPGASVSAIGITNQRETAFVWERSTGRPICNAIVWQCRRTSARCDGIRAVPRLARLIGERTGLPVDAYFSATKLEWMLGNTPGALQKARAGELLFGTADAWLLWKLTGGASHATDFTNASRTMLFDIVKRAWDPELLDYFGVPAAMLPEVRASAGLFGATVECGDLPAGIPVTGVAGDQQAALFGQRCWHAGGVKCTHGTGSFLLQNTGDSRPVSRHGLIVTLACGPEGEAVYALEGSVFVTGAAVQWLRDGLGILPSAPASAEMARSVADNGGVYFVPALAGLGAPWWDQDARGALYGITRATTPSHLVRAALEAIAYQTRDLQDAMEADSGLRPQSLKVDGGASANDFLCQFLADICRTRIVRPPMWETTALGAMYLAALGAALWERVPDESSSGEVFEPRMSPDQADELYRGWTAAVARTLTDRSATTGDPQ